MMYSPSYILRLPSKAYIVFIGLALAGISNAHLIVPTMDEMIDAGHKKLGVEENNEHLNDRCSGLFTMSLSLGEIFGPLIGNFLYTQTDFTLTTDLFGCVFIIFAVVYILCTLDLKSN